MKMDFCVDHHLPSFPDLCFSTLAREISPKLFMMMFKTKKPLLFFYFDQHNGFSACNVLLLNILYSFWCMNYLKEPISNTFLRVKYLFHSHQPSSQQRVVAIYRPPNHFKNQFFQNGGKNPRLGSLKKTPSSLFDDDNLLAQVQMKLSPDDLAQGNFH